MNKIKVIYLFRKGRKNGIYFAFTRPVIGQILHFPIVSRINEFRKP
jgi:hypothetical protein